MTPTPQEPCLTRQEMMTSPRLDPNKVVISGMSGLYPRSRNVNEFANILYNKVNPVTQKDLRFEFNHPEVVQSSGSIPELECFDAQFFKVNFRLAITMDPMAKKILEQSYQAIYDAGVNPEHLSGKKVGVYIGSCFSETEKATVYRNDTTSGLAIAGCSKTMFANRISYWLNAKGPSMSIDEACCSSTAALEQAYLAMTRGECEAAVVGGCYLCLHPQSSVHYGRIIKLCSDGKTKSFDEHADGCAKSEAVNVLFLQKAKDALRIYAEVINVKTEFISMLKEETGPKFGFYRNLNSTTNFIKKFYEDTNVPPQAIEYVEAFGSASPDADKVELQAIEEVFCKGRDDPLFIGSVMSNIGYGEAASGISAITKVLLGYHNGELAANLHCEHPRQDIAALREGRMRVVTAHQRFRRTYVAVNGMSVTGVNTHVLLHGYDKPKNPNSYKSSIPHLVTVSGRHEEAVQFALDELKSRAVDPEQLALLHNIHRTSVPGHLGRGFTILQTNEKQETVSLIEKAEYFDDVRRPLWFVYSGMGSQWTGMGAQLLRIPIFAAAIERCHRILAPKGLNIVNIITTLDESVFDNILHSFVGIAAIQIGLTDILRELGLKPDGIIGHSVGELGCAYADGCLSAEEMILAAYYRGLVSLETQFIRGSMAAVGMGYQDMVKICPPEIEIACHNGPASCTLSGPADAMHEFVAQLTAKEIFAKEVPCSNIPYHSSYIADAGPKLLKYLKEAIRTPKKRSERWFSSSVPEARWNEPIAKHGSAEYFTNNLLSPVLFEETAQLIPNDAVLVEVAPHGLLQAILKKSMPSSCINIPLTRRKHPDNAVLLLEAIGKLYVAGYNPNVHILYPKVEMPVSAGTPFLSHLVKWVHTEKWNLPLYSSATRRFAANCIFSLALQDDEHAYLEGHSMRGNVLYPFAGSLTLVWDTLAMTMGVPKKQLSVVFTDVQLHSQPVLHHRRQLRLSVAIHRGTGRFEILDGSSKVATGFINPLEAKFSINKVDKNENMFFNAQDVYQLLRDKDYSYSGEFESIKCVNESMDNAALWWRNNWVTLIDGMLQLNVLRQPHHAVSLPTRIRTLSIDVEAHCEHIQTDNSDVLMMAEVSEQLDKTKCGGIIMENIQFQNLSPVEGNRLSQKSLTFVPYHQAGVDVSASLGVYFQIVAENVNKEILTVVGIPNIIKDGSVFNQITTVVNNIYGIKVNYKQVSKEDALDYFDFSDVDLVLVQNLSTDENVFQMLRQVLRRDQFVMNEDDRTLAHSSSAYRVVSVHSAVPDTGNPSELQLIRWGAKSIDHTPIAHISVEGEFYSHRLSSLRSKLTINQRLCIICSFPPPQGLKELVSSWRKEVCRNKIHLIAIVNNRNKEMIEKICWGVELAFNVVNNNNWGGEYYIPLRENSLVSANVTLQSAQLGDYDSLKWVEAPELTAPGITVTVHYAGIHNSDVKKFNTPLYTKKQIDKGYGSDFSGITDNGERVMGIVHSGAASSMVRARPELLWPVPRHWTLEDAATVPLAYAQAFYCLGIKTKLRRGMTVLVHGGTGALGQAVISIALAHDCEVFTTVSDMRKKHFLRKLFPALKADHIGSSRDPGFADMVLMATDHEGCDVIISCAQGYLKNATLRCTAHHGTCFDISQIQNHDNFVFGMRHLFVLKNYATVDFSSIFADENVHDVKAINLMLSEGIARGYVVPLSRATYAPSDAARAFRLVSLSQHRGRVLLRLTHNTLQDQHRLRCDADSCHLLFCNDSMFELNFVDRLVDRGVKNICLCVRTQSSYLQHRIRSWERLGVKVIVLKEDLNRSNVSTILNKASQLAPLEGVYFIECTKFQEDLISNFDFALRQSCPELRYFAVLNMDVNTVGKAVCIQRLRDNLPATMLMLPDFNKTCSASWRSAVEAAERALRSTAGIVLAHTERSSQPSLLQQLSTLTGVNITDKVDKNLTLEELGVHSDKLHVISNYLQIQHNLAFDEDQLPSFTVNTMLELERMVMELPYEDVSGLQTFFSYVDSDELLATTDRVFLPTHVNSASLRDDEIMSDQKYMCIVPGLEGHYERFRVLCERLKLPAFVLQPGLDHMHETAKETAQRYTKVLLSKTKLTDSFYLLGYETGVTIALEMAAILEEHGLNGTVFCLGFAPDELKVVLEKELAEFETEEQLQEGVLRHMYTLMAGSSDTVELDRALRDARTWAQKVERCVRVLLGRVPHSAQYARALVECALARVQQARRSTAAARPLRSQLVLLRAHAPAPPQHAALQRHSRRALAVHQLSTPLAHVAADLRVAALLNHHLDPAILHDFHNRNICDTYLLNANSFVAVDADK